MRILLMLIKMLFQNEIDSFNCSVSFLPMPDVVLCKILTCSNLPEEDEIWV